MPSHAVAPTRKQRLLQAGGVFTTLLLAGLAFSQGLQPSAAHAASNLSCDQNTLYAITTGTGATGASGDVVAINAKTGATTALSSFAPANNGLGISRNGVAAYGITNGGTTLAKYDAASGATATVANVGTANQQVLRGAVDPVNGIYYYASGGATATLSAYDPAGNGTSIGQVGTITGLTAGKNGDFAFSNSGVLYVVDGSNVDRVNVDRMPTTAGTTALTTTLVAALPTSVNSAGIAFSTDGFLYASNVTGTGTSTVATIQKIDPSSGTVVASTPVQGNYAPSDLASCNYANTLSATTAVNERWAPTDQFALALTGDGLANGNTGTTTGSATGVQGVVAGPALAIPDQVYTAKQTGAGNTNLANYDTTWTATDAVTGKELASGTGDTASVTYPEATTADGSNVTFAFVNTLISTHVTAKNDAYSTPNNTKLTVTAANGVLANDTGTKPLTAAVASTTAHGTLSLTSDGSFTYTPTTGFTGTDSFTYTATDSAGVTSTATATIAVGPVTADDVNSVRDGSTLSVPASGVLTNDSGVGLSAALADAPTHGTATVSSNGAYTYTPDSGYSGLDTFTYRATDANGNGSTATVHITVLPQAVTEALPSTPVGTPVTVTAGPTTGVLANDLGVGLSVTSVTQPTNGMVTVSSTGTVVYTPTPRFSGTDSFTYTITDGSGNTSTTTDTTTVTPTAGDDTATATAGQTLTVDATGGVLSNDQGTGLTATVTKAPTHGTLTLGSDGSFTYTPTDGYSGPDSFTYTADDGKNSASATDVITVLPKANDDTLRSTSPGSTVTLATPGVLANDRGSVLTVTAVGTPAHGGSATIQADGSLSYTASTTFSGTDTFTYTVTDSHGQTSTATVNVFIRPTVTDDTLPSVPADRTTSIPAPGVLQNDHGDGLSVTSYTQPTHGSATVTPTGAVTYTPTGGYSGPDSFTYTVTDSAGSTATAGVAVSVTPTTASGSTIAIAGQDDTVPASSGALAGSSGQNLRVTGNTDGAHGTVNVASDGSYTYSPTGTYSGPDSFSFTAKDDSGNVTTGTIAVTVLPDAVDDRLTATTVGTPVDLAATGVLSNDVGSGLSVSSFTPAGHGDVTVDPDGSVVYKPFDGYSGRDSFTYTIVDKTGGTSTAMVSVRVNPTAGTVVLDPTASGVGETVAAPGVLASADGSGLVVSGSTQPSGGKATVNPDGSVTYTPSATFSGDDSFSYTVTDPSGDTATGTITVHVVPNAGSASTVVKAGTPDSVSAADGLLAQASGSTISASLDTKPSHGTVSIDRSGAYVYSADDGYSGPDSFTYKVTDSHGNVSIGRATVTVLPVAIDDTLPSTTAGGAATLPARGLLINDHGDTLKVTHNTNLANGDVSITSDGAVVYTPHADFSGDDSFDYTVTDSSQQTSTATVTVTVTPLASDDTLSAVAGSTSSLSARGVLTNDLGSDLTVTGNTTPRHGSATVDSNGGVSYKADDGYSGGDYFQYTAEDSSGRPTTATVSVTVSPSAASASITVVADGSDEVPASRGILSLASGSDLTAAVFTAPQHGNVTIDPTTGAYTYTPNGTYSGPDSFVYSVTDPDKGTATGTIDITVLPAAHDDSLSTVVGQAITVNTPGVLSNDIGTTLTVTDSTATRNGTVTVKPDGSIGYVPSAGVSGRDSFTYQVTDRFGNTSSATVLITIAPLAVNDAITTSTNTPITTTAGDGVLANDTGTGLAASSPSTPSHGRVTLRGSGAYTYTPDDDYSGPDSFTYVVSDSSGVTSTSVVGITVSPIAMLDTFTTTAGVSVHSDAPGVLTNDLGQGLGVVGKVTAAHGTVAVAADGTIDYSPNANFSGTDTFPYTINDDAGDPATGTITVVVTPVATDDLFTTPANTAVTFGSGDLTNNDDGTLLEVTDHTDPRHGKLVDNGNGTYTYTPTSGFSGSDSIVYTATDSSRQTTTATARIIVGDLAPDHTETTTVGKGISFGRDRGLLIHAVGSALVAALGDDGLHGHATVNGDGSFTYVPKPGFVGTDTFTYTVTDSTGQVSTGVVTVVVTAAPASAIDVRATGTPDQPVTLRPLGSDTPSTGSSFETGSFQFIDPATGLPAPSVTIPGSGTFSYTDAVVTFTPVKGFHGDATVAYRVTDTAAQTVSATITVTYPVATPAPTTIQPGDPGVAAAGSHAAGAGTPPAGLAFTGSEGVGAAALFGLLAMALGLAISLYVRRRRAVADALAPRYRRGAVGE